MLASKKRWNFDALIDHAASTELISELLANRGITSDEKDRFLNPSLTDLHNPDQLSGVIEAKARILKAIKAGEKIMILGDYDSDGVTSTALMMQTLQELGATCDFYIPNRFSEGYGPNTEAMQTIKERGFNLVITVDTGVAAIEALEEANRLGLDVIVTDHHEVQETLPIACAIVHPKTSKNYPFDDLAGVGVAFKLAHYLLGYLPKQFLDLVAIGTIADLVPLKNENRILTYHGLRALSQTERPGLVALKEIAGIKEVVKEEDVGFGIGPRLNAVGRLGDAAPAVELLLTNDFTRATQLAEEINLINQERQAIVKDIAAEAEAMVLDDEAKHSHVIVVAKAGWNEGVLGIVASRLVRTFQRPALVLALNTDKQTAKGSARSIDAFDLFKEGMALKKHFLKFGGHAQAAGMTLEMDQVEPLREALNTVAKEKLTEEDFKPLAAIEITLDFKQLSIKLVESLEQLAPFGMGNKKPVVHVKALPKEMRQIGASHDHLKLSLEQDGFQLNAIGFGFGDLYHQLNSQIELEAIGFLSVNEWNNARSVQLMVEDLRVLENQLFDYRGRKFWQKDILPKCDEDTLFIHFQTPWKSADYQSVSFDQFSDKQPVSKLIITDLPKDIEDFLALLRSVEPENIFLCFYTEDNFLRAFPTREDFKWLYGLILKQKAIKGNNGLKEISENKGWKINKIKFMIQVFAELEFVKVTDGRIEPHSSVEKRPLESSHYYQRAIKRKEVEDLLYYSSYHQLKSWLDSQAEPLYSAKEE